MNLSWTGSLLTAREVAARLHVHVNTVKRISIEQLPYFRILGRGDRRYRPQDVDEYLRRRAAARDADA